jgi:hypothetical protein
MTTYGGGWRYSSTIPEFDYTWKCEVSFMHLSLYCRGTFPCIYWGGPQSRSLRCGVAKHILSLLVIEPGSLASIPPLYRLSYPGSHLSYGTYIIANKCIKFVIIKEYFLPCCSHTWELAPAEFPQFLNQGQSVGLLGRVISSSQERILQPKIFPS